MSLTPSIVQRCLGHSKVEMTLGMYADATVLNAAGRGGETLPQCFTAVENGDAICLSIIDGRL